MMWCGDWCGVVIGVVMRIYLCFNSSETQI